MILECYKILKQIEQRPALWTGEATLKSIHIFISGYYQALLDHKIVLIIHPEQPFFEWVAKKLGYNESTAGWANMILAFTLGFKPEYINWEEVLATPVNKEQHFESVKFLYELIEQYMYEMENQ